MGCYIRMQKINFSTRTLYIIVSTHEMKVLASFKKYHFSQEMLIAVFIIKMNCAQRYYAMRSLLFRSWLCDYAICIIYLLMFDNSKCSLHCRLFTTRKS
ncbi:hypothetical protein T12_5412 [Trichinella patagoniensis]|uniref:Uncharacterized protein n=1 Tax=Trichinella patagoniensis TaxID=990121 RepID=A0A0V1A882_9BILA|nr:hypothetical protein T12_5412 [Trichinella patagoniensis]